MLNAPEALDLKSLPDIDNYSHEAGIASGLLRDSIVWSIQWGQAKTTGAFDRV